MIPYLPEEFCWKPSIAANLAIETTVPASSKSYKTAFGTRLPGGCEMCNRD